MHEKHFEIPLEYNAKRLDAALAIGFPDLSLRARRGLWKTLDIRVQGKPRPPAYKVRTGQRVDVLKEEAAVSVEKGGMQDVRIVGRSSVFAALFKPGMVHSVRGKQHGCIEDLLPTFFPDEEAFLLNRLDYLTSGLVLVGFYPESLDWYSQWQDEGQVVKTYLALVHGRLETGACVTQAIDSAKRRKVHVRSVENVDPIRHTLVTPLMYTGDSTLVKAEIRKGQRHQIRAHLAFLGHPIVGDPLYGTETGTTGEDGTMYLHHYSIVMPDFTAECLPDWDMDLSVLNSNSEQSDSTIREGSL